MDNHGEIKGPGEAVSEEKYKPKFRPDSSRQAPAAEGTKHLHEEITLSRIDAESPQPGKPPKVEKYRPRYRPGFPNEVRSDAD